MSPPGCFPDLFQTRQVGFMLGVWGLLPFFPGEGAHFGYAWAPMGFMAAQLIALLLI